MAAKRSAKSPRRRRDRDISERRRAEEHIRFLNAALFQANCAVIVVDIEGRITYWNRGAEQLYGFTSDEVYGRIAEDVLQVRWLEGESAETARRALAATGAWRGENVHTKKSGEEIYVESVLSLLPRSSSPPHPRTPAPPHPHTPTPPLPKIP